MDKLLGAFAAKYLLKFSFNQLLIYEQFIELNDDILYKFFLGQEKFPQLFIGSIGEFLQEFQHSLKLP